MHVQPSQNIFLEVNHPCHAPINAPTVHTLSLWLPQPLLAPCTSPKLARFPGRNHALSGQDAPWQAGSRNSCKLACQAMKQLQTVNTSHTPRFSRAIPRHAAAPSQQASACLGLLQGTVYRSPSQLIIKWKNTVSHHREVIPSTRTCIRCLLWFSMALEMRGSHHGTATAIAARQEESYRGLSVWGSIVHTHITELRTGFS